ncbi:MAG: hypothetical protein QXH42_09025, partial [Thermoplasmata archaeon]
MTVMQGKRNGAGRVRRFQTALLTLIMLSAGTQASGEAPREREGGPAAPREFVDPGGLYWRDDVQLTNDSAEEQYPVIFTDELRDSYICWYREGGHYFKKVDRLGRELVGERLLVRAPLPVQHSGQPLERFAVERGGTSHLVWMDEDWVHHYYRRFAPNGSPVCSPVDLTGMAMVTQHLCVAAGKYGRAYIAYENGYDESVELAYMDRELTLHSRIDVAASAKGVAVGVDSLGSPHVFTRALNGVSLYHARLSPDAVLDIVPHRIETPVLGSGLTTPVPSLAFGPDGAIHLLQTGSVPGERVLYYTKLDRDGNKLTNDILITSRAADYGGICAGPDRRVHIVWGDVSDGELYYVRIEPGRENETLAPCRLTYSNGADSDPRISADGNGGLHVVWRAYRGGRWDIYYKYADWSWVELAMRPEEMAKLMMIRPGETKSANLTLWNRGEAADTALLSLSLDPRGLEGWSASLDGEEVALGPLEKRNVELSVTAPRRGRQSDFIEITVECRSVNAPLRQSSVRLKCSYIILQAVMLSAPQEPLLVEPGGSAVHTITVRNTGDGVEDVLLFAEGPSNCFLSLNRSELEGLGPGEAAEVSLSVTSSLMAEADSMAVCTVTGWLRSNPEIRDAVSLRTVVSRAIELELEASPPSA